MGFSYLARICVVHGEEDEQEADCGCVFERLQPEADRRPAAGAENYDGTV